MRRFLPTLALLLFAVPAAAEEHQAFSDVAESRQEFAAVEDLHRRGIFTGRPDGTFGPDDFVNRAEAITVIVRAVANAENLPPLDSCFPDVHGEEWYVQPVCYAEDLGWVSGYPDGTFQPVRTVSKVEFLKILFNAYGEDTESVLAYSDSLSPDVRETDVWFFPYLASAFSKWMTHADDDGNLYPGAALTRGQVALLLHRYFLYRDGESTQALLVAGEKDIRLVLDLLSSVSPSPASITRASFAAAQARLLTWGAMSRESSSSVAKSAAKTADAAFALAQSFVLFRQGDLNGALYEAQQAYALAEQADREVSGTEIYTDTLRTRAHEMADVIREKRGG